MSKKKIDGIRERTCLRPGMPSTQGPSDVMFYIMTSRTVPDNASLNNWRMHAQAVR